ncbi:RagB/SusD family nutrient uptake outer membrane protein [Plebeiibacterium marinum]|uniref:RagB/SusD family nutrient uptake outer membrane protein n=1 Tax=Plebeiibacterium marinum TaxID=2992111 RepID=A0AAE3MAF1_9BACT|nr:RagB/SusD family nutrient uptake outer membrane protein [Plebeiobacterium marinum]MCW3804019.1 RagB/SusD family nutrient uptake outer membrane protein [Plebeiobacterium marinum]
MRKVHLLLITVFITAFLKAQSFQEMDALYQHLGRSDQFGKVIWAIGDACSDDSEIGASETALQNWTTFTHNSCDDYLYSFWLTSYKAINLCNQIISTDTISPQRKAEARFIRSLEYYYLANIFNNVPVFTDEFDPELNQGAFSSKTEVLASIDNDLQLALSDLPDQYVTGEKYRATKGAALTLLAKVALINQNWAQVKSYCDQIINSGVYSLEADFADNFSVTNKHGVESIFEIEQFDVSTSSSIYAHDGLNYHNFLQSPKGSKLNCPTLNLKNEFESGDIRLEATIFQNGDSLGDSLTIDSIRSSTGFYAKKYFVAASGHNGDAFIPNNIKVFRYADVLLMAAEASCNIGDMAMATQYIDMVRARAGLAASMLAGDAASALAAIRHERRVEFAMEGQRFFDLQRYNDLGIDMRQTLIDSGVEGASNFMSDIHVVFPIPSHVLYTNANAMQNPGYGYFDCVSVENPYRELTVSVNVSESVLDIMNAFCGSPIVTGYSNSDLLSASVEDSVIVLSYGSGQAGEATVTLKDYCGIFPVQETIHVNIVAAEPVAETSVTVSETEEKTTSFVISAEVFNNSDLGAGVTYTATLADGSPLPEWITFDPETLTFTIDDSAAQAALVTQNSLKVSSMVTALDLLIVASDEEGKTAAVEYTAEIKGAPTPVFGPEADDEVFVYPNPNNGEFCINTAGQDGDLKIFSVSGKLVYEKPSISSGEIVSLLNLPKGLYLYQFETQDTIHKGRIMIK